MAGNKLITYHNLRNDFHNREIESAFVPNGDRDANTNDFWQQELKVDLLSLYYTSWLNN